jgi:hypothetical protein
MKRDSEFTWVLVLAIVAIYLAAALVEPCDGHSCDAEVIDGR